MNCVVCGEPTQARRVFSNGGYYTVKRKTCSDNCKNAVKAKNLPKPEPRMSDCLYCQKRYRQFKLEQKYCSKPCAIAGEVATRVTVTCYVCKTEFKIIPSRYENSYHKRFLCSIRCKSESQKCGFALSQTSTLTE